MSAAWESCDCGDRLGRVIAAAELGRTLMSNAILIGMSRQMALQRELDVVSNNIANINTTGFKGGTAVFEAVTMPGASHSGFGHADRKMSYVHDRSTWHDLTQGPMRQTGNPLDVAIDGKAFLVVQTPKGERYTRNGSFQINATGELITSEGHKVLGESGPIQFQVNDKDITISRDGTIAAFEGVRGKLRLVEFENSQSLQKDGSSNFATSEDMQPTPAKFPNVIQNALEQSNVKAIVEMTRMIEVSRQYSKVSELLQKHGETRRSAIERLAEVPA